MEIIFSNNNQNIRVCRNDLYGFLGICDPPGFEPDDTSEANSQNYFAVGFVEYKENIATFPTTNADN